MIDKDTIIFFVNKIRINNCSYEYCGEWFFAQYIKINSENHNPTSLNCDEYEKLNIALRSLYYDVLYRNNIETINDLEYIGYLTKIDCRKIYCVYITETTGEMHVDVAKEQKRRIEMEKNKILL